MAPTVAEILQTMSYGPAPESAKPANEWLDAHQRRFGCWIDGGWTAPDEQRLFASVNPATRAPLAKVTQASAAEVDLAVDAARRAFPAWSALPGHARARYLYALARLVQKHARLLAVLESLDNGKPIRESRDLDIPLVARHFYHHAGWAQLLASEFAGYRPHGVVGQIVPWNFPLLMVAWKVAPALAAGNTVVLKPAEWTPLTALVFAEICHEAGLPPGVVNIVTGDGAVGELIVNHAGVDKIAFTGSTDVGRIIRRATAGSGKALSLELGGKSPFVVFDDADMDAAIEGVVDAIWFNQGQVCCAGSRLLLQESIAPEFERRLVARMETLRVGDPLDKAIDIGPIVAERQLRQIEALVAQGVAEGATCHQPSGPCPSDGYYFPPTLLSGVEAAATVARVEIFGPVLVSMTFRTPQEAVALANNTTYGLAASVWSENINLALDAARQIKAGVVWVNATNLFDAAAGFGGYRESGYGREGGREGMWEYLRRNEPDQEAGRQGASDQDASAASQNSQWSIVNSQSPIDRTPKLFVGGKQARPDSGYSRAVYGAGGALIAEVGDGNRKDIRNAVESARAATGWASATGHARAQVVYYIAENLAARAAEFARRLMSTVGCSAADASAEVEFAIETLFSYAALADKHDGAVHQTPLRGVTLAMPEPMGVIGICCPDERPLAAAIALLAPALAMGNAVVLVPSERAPLSMTDFYSVLETSDVPAGAVNIVTGARDALAKTLAEHLDVDALWYAGDAAGGAMVERLSAGNLKRTWTIGGERDWLAASDLRAALRQATQVKNIWIPYGA